jgi:hypothetical protein
MLDFKEYLYYNESQVLTGFTRKVKNYTLSIDPINLEIVKLEKEIQFAFIDPTKKLNKLPNTQIVTFDIECIVSKNVHQPFACSYYTEDQNGKHFKFFYLTSYKNPNEILKSALLEIITKFSPCITYIHNLSRYDLAFLNEILNNYFKVKYKFKDNQILSVDVTYIQGDNKYSIKIRDSLLLLTKSLDKLCKAYNLDANMSKSKFPYTFPSLNNLNYSGKVPEFHHFNNIPKEIYEKLVLEYGMQNKNEI